MIVIKRQVNRVSASTDPNFDYCFLQQLKWGIIMWVFCRVELLNIVRKHSLQLQHPGTEGVEVDPRFWCELLDLFFVRGLADHKIPEGDDDDLVFFVRLHVSAAFSNFNVSSWNGYNIQSQLCICDDFHGISFFSKCSGDCPPEIGSTEPWLWGGRAGGLECQILISCARVFYQTAFFCTQVGCRGRFSKFIEPHFSV